MIPTWVLQEGGETTLRSSPAQDATSNKYIYEKALETLYPIRNFKVATIDVNFQKMK